MEYSKYQYTVLCEDKSQYHFVRGWLAKKGVKRIHSWEEFPHRGSGKSFVLKNFDEAMQKVKMISARAKTVLIVVIDADNQSVDNILCQFKSADQDPVFFVITKWSIETWARCLLEPENPENLDESKSCKMQSTNRVDYAKLGKQLASMEMGDQSVFPASLWATAQRIKKKKASLGL